MVSAFRISTSLDLTSTDTQTLAASSANQAVGMSAESPLPAGWSSPIGSAQSKDIGPAVEIDERRPPVDPGRLRCERVLDFLTCADWAPSNMVGANADGDRGLVYACQQSQRTAQAELVADLEGDRTAVQVRPADGFAAPLARRGLRHDAAA